MNNIDKKQTIKKGVTNSKVIDSIKNSKNKPPFEKVILEYERGNKIKLKSGVEMYTMGNDDYNLHLEKSDKTSKISLDKKHYNELVEKVTLTTNYDRAYKECYCKSNMGIFPIRGDTIQFKSGSDKHTGKIVNMLPEDTKNARFLIELGNSNIEIDEKDIMTINNVSREHYYKFYHTFGQIYERGIRDVEVVSKNNKGDEVKFSGMILGIGEDKNGVSLAIQTVDAEMKSTYLNEVVKMNGKDYTNLDYNYSVELINGELEIFNNNLELVEYIEEDLQSDFSSVKKIYRAHYLDDNYLSERDEDITKDVARQHMRITNINVEEIDDSLVTDLSNYKFIGYYASELNKIYQYNNYEEDLEVTEQLFKDSSFYFTHDGYDINYIIDPRSKQIILTHFSDEGTVTFNPDDISNNFSGLFKEDVEDYIINDMKSKSDENKLISKLGNKFNLESDSQMDELRNMFHGYEIKKK